MLRRRDLARRLPAQVRTLLVGFVEGFNAADAERIVGGGAQSPDARVGSRGGHRAFSRADGDDQWSVPARALQCALRLGVVVTRAGWGADGVRIEARGAPRGGVLPELRARAALVTVLFWAGAAGARSTPPVGAIAFTPALPAWKRAAIRAAGDGRRGRDLWCASAIGSALVRRRSPQHRLPASAGRRCSGPGGRLVPSHIAAWRWIAGPAADRAARGSPSAETAATAGDRVRRLRAALYGTRAGNGLCRVAGGHRRRPDCRWAADPYARGAYSYIPVGGLDAPAELGARSRARSGPRRCTPPAIPAP